MGKAEALSPMLPVNLPGYVSSWIFNPTDGCCVCPLTEHQDYGQILHSDNNEKDGTASGPLCGCEYWMCCLCCVSVTTVHLLD